MYTWHDQLCPICGIKPSKYLGKRGGVSHREGLGVECEIWQCRRCSLIFPNPMPVPAGGLSQHYKVPPDEYFAHHDPGGRLEGAKRLLEEAHSLLGSTGTLLDVGSGRGEMLKAATESGWQAIGLEPSPTFAAHAASYSGAKVLTQPIEACSLPAESVDAVILAAVLEHLYDPDAVTASIARLLRPGGLLYVDVPNEQGLYFLIGNLYQKIRGRRWVVNLAPTFSPFHLFGFSPTSLRMLLSKHGLVPRAWRVYEGVSFVPRTPTLSGSFESLAARVVTAAGRFGELGSFIETWAVKK